MLGSLAAAGAVVFFAQRNGVPAGPATDRVDALFAPWNRSDSPGCGVGISRHGAVLYERGYGMANLELRVPIKPDTVFDAASISKQFTAMSVLFLAQRGQISLDDEVGKYIRDWGDRRHRVTIRHLLTHTSGLREAFLLQGLAPERPQHINQQILNILTRATGFEFEPGSRFEYNDGAYALLATIVERVSGQPFAAFAEAHMFKPLAMAQTHFHDDATRVVPNRATGYSRSPNGFRVAVRTYTDTVVGNAGLFTTVGDLLRWQQNLADVRIGDAALMAEMQKPAIAMGSFSTSHYGFGVEIAQHRGLRTIGHGGGDEGRRTYTVRYPDHGLAIAVLCNVDDLDPRPLAQSVAEAFLPDAFPEPATTAEAAPPTVSLSQEELQRRAGFYQDLSDQSIGRIFMRDGRLMASESASDSEGYELRPIAPNRFTIVGTSIVAEFVPPRGNSPQQLHVSGGGPKPAVMQMLPHYPNPSDAELRAFQGTYTSNELHGTYTVVARDGGLVVEIAGRADIPLEPIIADTFSGNMFGVVKFSRDSHRRVIAFTAHAPGIRALQFNRVR